MTFEDDEDKGIITLCWLISHFATLRGQATIERDKERFSYANNRIKGFLQDLRKAVREG
jgi:hypothetical protein